MFLWVCCCLGGLSFFGICDDVVYFIGGGEWYVCLYGVGVWIEYIGEVFFIWG